MENYTEQSEETKDRGSIFEIDENEEMFNPSMITEESCYNDLIKMLTLFEEMDKFSKNWTKDLKTKLKKRKSIEKRMHIAIKTKHKRNENRRNNNEDVRDELRKIDRLFLV